MRFRRITHTDPEATVVESMVDEAFGFYGGPYWRWKYADAAGAPGIVIVAESEGEVVGCSHYVVTRYHLGEGCEVEAVFGGDLLVAPELRRKHIATDLSLASREIVLAERPEAALVTMYTWRALGEHYERLLGYTRVQPAFLQWSKRLSWDDRLDEIVDGNTTLVERYPRLRSVDHLFTLRVAGSPPLTFQVTGAGFLPFPEANGRRQIEVDIRNPGAIGGRGVRGLLTLGLGLLTGKVRLRGSLSAIWQAVRVTGAYRDVLGRLRS